MPIGIQILREYLPDRIFHILTFHTDNAKRFLTANKVNPFLWKANVLYGKFKPTLRPSPGYKAFARTLLKNRPSAQPGGIPRRHFLHYTA